MPVPAASLDPRTENLVVADLGTTERLAAAYAPGGARARWHALLALDANLRRAALAPSEAIAAQLRLAWWREACAELATSRGHPVIAALSQTWHGSTEPLVALVDSWEAVALAPEGIMQSAEALAVARASVLAGPQAAIAFGPVKAWTVVALSSRALGGEERQQMLDSALETDTPRLPRGLRPLIVLAGLARRAARRGDFDLLADRGSFLAAMRLGIIGR